MCCLSKGLCAPVGSVLAGEHRHDRRGPRRTTPPRRGDATSRNHRCGRARRARTRWSSASPTTTAERGALPRLSRHAGPTQAAIPSEYGRTSSSSRTRTRRSCSHTCSRTASLPARSRLTWYGWSPTTTSTTKGIEHGTDLPWNLLLSPKHRCTDAALSLNVRRPRRNTAN